jgi:hypothetical protein
MFLRDKAGRRKGREREERRKPELGEWVAGPVI